MLVSFGCFATGECLSCRRLSYSLHSNATPHCVCLHMVAGHSPGGTGTHRGAKETRWHLPRPLVVCGCPFQLMTAGQSRCVRLSNNILLGFAHPAFVTPPPRCQDGPVAAFTSFSMTFVYAKPLCHCHHHFWLRHAALRRKSNRLFLFIHLCIPCERQMQNKQKPGWPEKWKWNCSGDFG